MPLNQQFFTLYQTQEVTILHISFLIYDQRKPITVSTLFCIYQSCSLLTYGTRQMGPFLLGFSKGVSSSDMRLKAALNLFF